MEEKANYHQTLSVIEQGMVESSIRLFCEEHCKGFCCGRCFTSENACHKNEGRRLACSFFVCYNLRNLIFSEESEDSYRRLAKAIEFSLYEAGLGWYSRTLYFTPYHEKVIKEFSFPYLDDLKRFYRGIRNPTKISSLLSLGSHIRQSFGGLQERS